MGRRVTAEAPTDEAVREWLRAKGIDPHDVTGYAVRHKAGDFATIKLTMIFDEVPDEKAEKD